MHSKTFAKFDRYTLGQKVFESLLGLVADIYRAQYLGRETKLAALRAISIRLDALKILIRFTHSLNILAEPQYVLVEGELQNIGQMLGGWIKSLTPPPQKH